MVDFTRAERRVKKIEVLQIERLTKLWKTIENRTVFVNVLASVFKVIISRNFVVHIGTMNECVCGLLFDHIFLNVAIIS